MPPTDIYVCQHIFSTQSGTLQNTASLFGMDFLVIDQIEIQQLESLHNRNFTAPPNSSLVPPVDEASPGGLSPTAARTLQQGVKTLTSFWNALRRTDVPKAVEILTTGKDSDEHRTGPTVEAGGVWKKSKRRKGVLFRDHDKPKRGLLSFLKGRGSEDEEAPAEDETDLPDDAELDDEEVSLSSFEDGMESTAMRNEVEQMRRCWNTDSGDFEDESAKSGHEDGPRLNPEKCLTEALDQMTQLSEQLAQLKNELINRARSAETVEESIRPQHHRTWTASFDGMVGSLIPFDPSRARVTNTLLQLIPASLTEYLPISTKSMRYDGLLNKTADLKRDILAFLGELNQETLYDRDIELPPVKVRIVPPAPPPPPMPISQITPIHRKPSNELLESIKSRGGVSLLPVDPSHLSQSKIQPRYRSTTTDSLKDAIQKRLDSGEPLLKRTNTRRSPGGTPLRNKPSYQDNDLFEGLRRKFKTLQHVDAQTESDNEADE